MLRSVLTWLGSAIVPVLFLSCALRPGCVFNFVPFAIHQAFFRDALDEYIFIVAFDIAVALLLFFLSQSAIRRLAPSRKA